MRKCNMSTFTILAESWNFGGKEEIETLRYAHKIVFSTSEEATRFAMQFGKRLCFLFGFFCTLTAYCVFCYYARDSLKRFSNGNFPRPIWIHVEEGIFSVNGFLFFALDCFCFVNQIISFSHITCNSWVLLQICWQVDIFGVSLPSIH